MNIILTPDSVLKHLMYKKQFCDPLKLENLFSKHFRIFLKVYQLKILKIHFFAPPLLRVWNSKILCST